MNRRDFFKSLTALAISPMLPEALALESAAETTIYYSTYTQDDLHISGSELERILDEMPTVFQVSSAGWRSMRVQP